MSIWSALERPVQILDLTKIRDQRPFPERRGGHRQHSGARPSPHSHVPQCRRWCPDKASRSWNSVRQILEIADYSKVFCRESLLSQLFQFTPGDDSRISLARLQTFQRGRSYVAVEGRSAKEGNRVKSCSFELPLKNHPSAETILSIGQNMKILQVLKIVNRRLFSV